MTNTKKSLLASGLSLAVSAALLVGTTFAWFTDSVTNTGNKIQAGTLEIALNDGTDTALFSSEDFLWEPGRSQKATAKVTNEGSLWLKYTMSFENVKLDNAEGVDADITKVLDVYTVAAGAANLTGATKLGTMAELMAAGSFAAKDAVLAPKGQTGTVNGAEVGDTQVFTIVIKMQESAGNEYQGAGVSFDVSILAAQYTYEKDGFDNDRYDADAEYFVDIASEESLISALNAGYNVNLTAPITLSKNLTVSAPAILLMNGQNITFEEADVSWINVSDSLTIEGNGKIIGGGIYVESNASLTINAGDDFVIESDNKSAAVIGTDFGVNSDIMINGGTYKNTYPGGSLVINDVSTGKIIIKNAKISVTETNPYYSSNAVINITRAKKAVLENVTVDAKGYSAVYFGNDDATIIGGEYKTTAVASLGPVETIEYVKSLNISDAVITRVGVGILYSSFDWPLPEEIQGLTQSNVTFKIAGDVADNFQDVDYNKI